MVSIRRRLARARLNDAYRNAANLGVTGVLGAAAVKVSRILDGPHGPVLPLNQLVSQGRRFKNAYGLRKTIAAVLRAFGLKYFPRARSASTLSTER